MMARLNSYSNLEKKPSVRSDEMSTVLEGQTQNALKYFENSHQLWRDQTQNVLKFWKKAVSLWAQLGPSVLSLNWVIYYPGGLSSNPKGTLLTVKSVNRSWRKKKKISIFQRKNIATYRDYLPLTLKKGHLKAISNFKTESVQLLTSQRLI